VVYKGKSLEKTLYISFCIDYIGDKKMKVVQVGNSRYYISSRDDEVSLVHQLIKQGYSIQQIAQFLGISEKKVKKYMSDCW